MSKWFSIEIVFQGLVMDWFTKKCFKYLNHEPEIF